jgi:FlaA1/EpsC-like NDP-sugar epimerase
VSSTNSESRRSALNVLLLPSSSRVRRGLQVAADAVLMAAAVWVAANLRYEFALPRDQIADTAWFGLGAAVLFVACAAVRGLYAGRWGYGTFDEVSALVSAIGLTTVALWAIDVLLSRPVPLSVPFIASTIVVCLAAGVRYVWRLTNERRLLPSGEVLQPIIVIGAGEAGNQIVTAMLRNPHGRYLPVALIDDNPQKRNVRIRSVRVSGTREDLAEIAAHHGAKIAVLAVPSAPSSVIRDFAEIARRANVQLLVVPSVSELYGARVDPSQIRPVSHADLLGRGEVDTDIESIAGYVTGKRVLVTGAGGSIGSELSRQLYRFAPSSLILLDRDESALHAVQLSIEGRALLDSRNLVVADIRDVDRMAEVFEEHQPHVVFHAAALKHLPLLEMHPGEALKTNVWGTHTLVEVANATGVERFVNVSTDKAADPTSVLGYTKRLAERVTAEAAVGSEGVFLSVRFGNVLGSRGSVLKAFAAQIEAGGPVTVTDIDVTRYFMTVEEAVQLVIQAGAVGRPGEALVLDMGEPIRINDVAKRLIAEADRPIEIVYTGLRDGEKLHEVLLGSDEVGQSPCHPRICHVTVPTIDIGLLPVPKPHQEDAQVIAALREACELPVSSTPRTLAG